MRTVSPSPGSTSGSVRVRQRGPSQERVSNTINDCKQRGCKSCNGIVICAKNNVRTRMDSSDNT